MSHTDSQNRYSTHRAIVCTAEVRSFRKVILHPCETVDATRDFCKADFYVGGDGKSGFDPVPYISYQNDSGSNPSAAPVDLGVWV